MGGRMSNDPGNEEETGRASSYRIKALLSVILVLAAGLRLYGVEKECPWYDEITSLRYLQASNPIQYALSVQAENPVSTPVYFQLEYFWACIFGPSVPLLRVVSVVLGTAGIFVVYLLAARLFSPLAGLLAALFLALNGFHRYYSMELRPYILVLALAGLSGYAFLLAIETRKKRFWAASLACNLLMVWTHVFSGLFFLPQGLILLGRLRHHRLWFVLWGMANGFFLLTALLWIKLLDRGAIFAAASWMPKPSLLGFDGQSALGFYAACAGEQNAAQHPPGWSLAGPALWVLVFLALVAGVIALWRAPKPAGADTCLGPREKLLFLLVWLLAPPTILFVLSYLWVPCFVYRYLFYCLLPFWILVGGGLAAVRNLWFRASGVLTLCVLMCVQALPILGVPQRPDWQTPARLIQQCAGNGTPVLAVGFADTYCLRYFLGSRFQVEQSESVSDMADRAASLTLDHAMVFALLRDNWTNEDRARFESALTARKAGYQTTCIPSARTMYLYRFSGKPAQGQSGP